MKKYYDEKFDYNLSLINKKTLLFLKYAWKDANHPDVVRGGVKCRLMRFLDICWCFLDMALQHITILTINSID